MKNRTQTEISIYRRTSNAPSLVATVPITKASSRKFMLMQEDSVTLSFTLATAVSFAVGDYIDDELFGHFVIREKQMPAYQKTSAGYKYTLRFDRHYWIWENHLFMLTTTLLTEARVRKEASWMLTEKLVEHAKEIVRNLDILSLAWNNLPYCVVIHDSAEKAEEVRYISYDGVKICSALTQMANEFECEWWVTYGVPPSGAVESDGESVNTGTTERGIIHFGKCEENNTPLVFSLGQNVEDMTIARNSSTYANRLFVAGGTKNVPESYRKSLKFQAHILKEETNQYGERVIWFNGLDKTVTYDMTSGERPFAMEIKSHTVTYESSHVNHFDGTVTWHQVLRLVNAADFTNLADGVYRFDGLLCNVVPKIDWSGQAAGATGSLTVRAYVVASDNTRLGNIGEKSYEVTAADDGTIYEMKASSNLTLSTNVSCKLGVEVLFDITIPGTAVMPELEPLVDTFDDFEIIEVTDKKDFGWLPLTFNNTEYWIILRRLNDYGYAFSFCYQEGYSDLVSPPSGFVEGCEYTLPYYNGVDAGLLITKIPYSWYVSDYDDPSSLITIGERRLLLPVSTNGYVQTTLVNDETKRVEAYIIAEHIYPRLYLKVTSVTTEERTAKEEMSDGTTAKWKWTAYKVTVVNINGNAFPFDRSFVKAGEKLQAVFVSEIDEARAYEAVYGTGYESHIPAKIDGSGAPRFLLAGMTFDVSYDRAGAGTYTLIRSDDYGAQLPNDILYPKVGDTLVLTGWDVKAMESLGLIAAAETELLAFANDYLAAIEEDQFTFTCNMMSNAFHPDKLGYLVTDGHYSTAQGEPILVNNGLTLFLPPKEGTRVTIVHGAISGGKTSRVIGYNLKFDMPYDTPSYIVGETETYSRLRKIEKLIKTK